MPAASPRIGQRYIFGSGSRPLEGYTIKRAIGRGGFGEVYYATSDAGKEVALKLLTRNVEIERRGVLHCMNLKSPHLITIFDLKDGEEGDTFVIMEYVSGPSLASLLTENPGGLPPAEVRRWLKGLVDGVAYLHDHGIVHRDLKPANLFLEEGVVKIGDYGLSKSIAHSANSDMSENVGTCYYMAPEIASGKYHKPIDIYAIGVILFEMLTGRVPFEGESTGEVLMKHLTAQPDLVGIAEPYRSILRRALAKDPVHRPQRAHELLPPGEAPAAPDIRVIEKDGAVAPTRGLLGAARPAEPEPDVLHIDHEEPVLYIGPDTMPPGMPRTRPGRLAWARRGAAVNARRDRKAAAQPVKRRRWWPFGGRGQTRMVAATQPLVPPPLPAPRFRVAELAGSMLCAAPLAGLASAVSLPAYEAFGINLPQDPLQLAFLFTMVLLGTWTVLIPAKLWETRGLSTTQKRLGYMAAGLILGWAALGLSRWTHINPAPPIYQVAIQNQAPEGWPSFARSLLFAGYFGLAYALVPWWKMTDRGRPARFRFWPAIQGTVLVALLGVAWPSPQAWGVLVALLIAVLTQIVSPWDRATSEYASALRVRTA